MIEVRNLSFSYRNHQVLKDVSFVVSSGEIVSIVGANGSGKTTLMRVLSTLLIPDSGMLLNEGRNAFDRPRHYCRQLGYLPEKYELYEEMTVREYLVYRAKLKGEATKRIRRRVSETIDICRLSAETNISIRRLSEGMKRRVAFADAILLRPRFLLLDDFLNGLDTEMRVAMGEILTATASFSSVLVTGHELTDFVKWSTRFLILRDGVIAETVENSGAQSDEIVKRIEHVLVGGVK